MKRKSYIKNLEYKLYSNFGKRYLSVNYERNGEQQKYTLSNVPNWICDDKTVRKFINN